MRYFTSTLILLLFLFCSCGPEYSLDTYSDKKEYRRALISAHRKALKDETVLATFKGGVISTAAMIRYGQQTYGLESVVGSVNRIDCLLSSLRKQRLLLREMIEKRIFLAEARLRDFSSMPDVRSMLEYIDHKALIPIHFREVIRKQLFIREPALYVQHLLLRFPRTIPDAGSAVLPPWAVAVRNQAVQVRGKALRGRSFESLVGRYSRDYTKSKNGHLGWIVASSMGKRYWAAVSGLRIGAVSRPIVMENGVYLARVLKKRVLTAKDFRKYLHGRFAYQLQEDLQKNGKKRFMEKLYRGRGVYINEKLLAGGKPEALLARIGKWKITLGEYETRFKAFSKGYKISTFSTEKRLKWRRRFLKEYLLTPRLIIRDALRLGLDRTPVYKKALLKNRAIRERVLYIEMKDYLFRTGAGAVSEEKVRRIYQKYRKSRYFSLRAVTRQQAEKYPDDMVVKKKGRIFVKVLQPFESVKAKATRKIVRDIRYKWLDAFVMKKMRAMNFTIAPLKRFSVVYYTGKR